jgi:hypothetical protein
MNGQQATVRRRLMVGDATRQRGPGRRAELVFLGESKRRAEGACLISMLRILSTSGTSQTQRTAPASLEIAENLCEVHEAYCTCFPNTTLKLEELVALRSSLARRKSVLLNKCRSCGCLMISDAISRDGVCPHCMNGDQY